jgi:3-oxoacyl-[acyl-carrier protein] reductase
MAPRVVFISGGSRGIGKACADCFRDAGDRVAVASRSLPSECVADNYMTLHCDVRSDEDVIESYTLLEKHWGAANVVVANAGAVQYGPAIKTSGEQFLAQLNLNLGGAFRIARRAAPQMMRSGDGRIVMVSSIAGQTGVVGAAAYASAKAGMVGLTRSLARELGPCGVTVNTVAAGPIDTDLTADRPMWTLSVTRDVPMGRYGTPQEVAAAVYFLASAKAAYVTGAILPVDGGIGMGH